MLCAIQIKLKDEHAAMVKLWMKKEESFKKTPKGKKGRKKEVSRREGGAAFRGCGDRGDI